MPRADGDMEQPQLSCLAGGRPNGTAALENRVVVS